MRGWTIGILGLLAVTAALAEGPATNAVLMRAQIDQKLAALVHRQVEISFELRDQGRKNEALWLDPKYTSPEIETLRQRLATLRQTVPQTEAIQQQAARTTAALRQAVEALPEARAELAKIPGGKTEYQRIVQQIEELQKQREQAP